MTYAVLILTLAVLSIAHTHGRSSASPRRRALPACRDPESAIRDDDQVEHVGTVLARALDLTRRARSHRKRQMTLAGELEGRGCELRIAAEEIRVRLPVDGRMPDGIDVQRERPGQPCRVDLGYVRGRVPPGMVPVLVAACDERVSAIRLAKGRIELSRALSIAEFGGQPERVVALLKHALRLAERLERDFRHAC